MIVACVAATPLLIAAAPEPVRLKPTSQWIVDYADNSCRLVRTFGEGDDKTVLSFESATPDRATMLVLGKPLASSLMQVPARFRPDGAEAFGIGIVATTGAPGILWSHVPLWPEPSVDDAAIKKMPKRNVRPEPVDQNMRAAAQASRLALASATTELEINTGDRPVILETGSLGEAVRLFDECGRDSLRDWGLDPDIQDKIVRPVWTANLLKWITPNIYPPQIAKEHKESNVNARLIVDATGKVTSCTSLSLFDAPEFKKAVCDAFKRAKFEPAELADGTKVPSYYATSILFRTSR
jgi:TonB family protein